MTLKIGVAAGVGAEAADFVAEAERLGVDSAWSVEAWGYDALTPLAFLASLFHAEVKQQFLSFADGLCGPRAVLRVA